MHSRQILGAAVCLLAAISVGAAEPEPRIAWYGTLQDGLAEAQRSGRPILLVSGAPHCQGVSGIW
jgi:hypothetical protein